ncbi:MAG: glucosaminidase domain-containing protein [Bacteroidaceae bacterium]|nr:glucosaminidase domain-containing protein [Bacteroidaceae bacterium]
MKRLFDIAVLAFAAFAVSCSTSRQLPGGQKTVEDKDNVELHPVSTSDAYVLYIDRYSATAVEQMERYGIPASITLAQGLLESDAGRSSLAVGCNNHFGIKCHSDWKGGRTYKDDDSRNECFRCYDSAQESFEDHSLFLKNGSRYADLFSLSRTDYKGWAKGLKAAGYATNPKYADQLVSLVERYGLDRFDKPATAIAERRVSREAEDIIEDAVFEVLEINGCRCIRLQDGVTFKAIAEASGISRLKLRRYNDMTLNMKAPDGSLIYIDRKKTRAEKEFRTYEIGPDDSLWNVSQRYGVRMSALMHRNGLKRDSGVYVGQVLKLR